MSHIIAIPRTHADQLYMGYKFLKQFDILMEYVHSILILRQPEIYISSIFYHNGAQIELTWRHVETQQMFYGTINLYNTIDLPKSITVCKAIFNTIVAESCTFGTSPYADLFI